MTGLLHSRLSSGGYFNASQDPGQRSSQLFGHRVTFVNDNSDWTHHLHRHDNIVGATFAPGGTTSTPEPASL
jgi:hypothetical protein